MSATAKDLIATCWTTAGDAVPIPGLENSPLDLHARIDAAARAGFTGFGILHHDLAVYLASGHTLEELRQRMADAGIRYVELEFLTGWWLAEDERTPDQQASTQLLLQASEVLEPYHVKTGPDIAGGQFHLEQYAERFHDAAEAFRQVGTVLSMEFMPFADVSTLAQAVDLVRTAGHPGGGLMIDLWHLMRGSGTLEELRSVPLEYITGVELDDADAQQVGTGYEDTVLRRKLCGQGDFPVVPFIRTLQAMGWSGPWGLEIISETYRKRPMPEAVAEAFTTTMASLAAADRVTT
jgi:sugar phosphate isomerase/epimerase